MATPLDFIEYVCDQIDGAGTVRYKKMFGEYMIYVNDKPLLLVCDSAVYVKMEDGSIDVEKFVSKGWIFDAKEKEFDQLFLDFSD